MTAKQQRWDTQQAIEPRPAASSHPASFQQPRGNAAAAEHLRLATPGNGGPGTESGEPATDEQKREVYLRHAQAVVTESNERAAAGEDDFWKGANGGNIGVELDEGLKPEELRGGKRPEWWNGIHVDNNEFHAWLQPRGSVDALGIDTIDELRTQIQDDLNFNGIFEKFKTEEEFTKALIDRFGEGCKEREIPVRPIAENLWAYGTTGMDVKQRTDVGELQGMLYLLDPMIAEASESNTKHGGNFSIEDKQGSSTTFDKHGDDDYGRASSLECRLLSSLLDSGDHKITGYDESYLLLDGSGSYVGDEYAKLAKLIETGGLDGSVALAGFASGENTLEKFESGDTMDTDRAKALLLAVSLFKAKQKQTPGVSSQDIHDALAKGGVTTVPDALMGTGGLQHEEGLACALAWLKQIEEGPDFDPTDGVKRQLLVATDEPDFNPGILEDLQTKATEMNFSVKVQYSFTNGAESTIYGGKGDSYVIIDIMALDVEKVMAGKYAGSKGGSSDGREDRTKQLDWYIASKDQTSKVESW